MAELTEREKVKALMEFLNTAFSSHQMALLYLKKYLLSIGVVVVEKFNVFQLQRIEL